MSDVSREVAERKRFNFGENWNRFLTVLDEEHIREAEKSLKQMLEAENLEGKFISGYRLW